MKKFLRILAISVVLLVLAFYFIAVPKFVSLITDYDRHTFEYVTDNPEILENYGIGAKRTPADYGFDTYREIDYNSLTDEVALNGWYMPAAKEGITQTLMINHGRTSNRLKTMKYLELVKAQGLDTLYNVFIPDLRNSGKSQEAKTALGYEFAEDIVGSMKMLNENYGQTDFVLWGFSMGAMASAVAINRPDLVEFQKENGLKVHKLILDSPLSNIKETARLEGQGMGIPNFIFNMAWGSFDKKVNGYSDKMKLSYLLNNTKLPTLILYSDGDKTTPASILETEVEGLFNVYPVLFKDCEHVKLYTREEYKERYTSRVNTFLRSNDL